VKLGKMQVTCAMLSEAYGGEAKKKIMCFWVE